MQNTQKSWQSANKNVFSSQIKFYNYMYNCTIYLFNCNFDFRPTTNCRNLAKLPVKKLSRSKHMITC